MDSNLLRKRLTNVIDRNGLTFTEVERGAGIPRAVLRNFINGKVKEPKLDVILAAARFLQVDLNDLLTQSQSLQQEHIKDSSPQLPGDSEYLEKQLLVACVKSLIDYLNKNNITMTLDKSLELIKNIYDYSIRYTDRKLDSSFLEWYLPSHTS